MRQLARKIQKTCGWLQDSFGDAVFGRAQGLCLPDFLGIGAQKAGSSWLVAMLKCHPEIYVPRLKKQHYFNRHYHRSLRYYSRQFKPGATAVKGEVTAAYSILPLEKIHFIRAIIPDVRLILFLRNPIDRAWSHAMMDLAKKRQRTYEDVEEAEFYAHFNSGGSVKRGDYPTILDNWLSVFPREQLFVGFFEEIAQRPRELLADVFEHIGVSRDVDWDSIPYGVVKNKGLGTSMPRKYRDYLQEMYKSQIAVLHARFGERVAEWR